MIKWNYLDWYLRVGIVGGWIIIIIYLLSFAYGIVLGMFGN